MSILREHDIDETLVALGAFKRESFIIKWCGDKHEELINTAGFSAAINTVQRDRIMKTYEGYKNMDSIENIRLILTTVIDILDIKIRDEEELHDKDQWYKRNSLPSETVSRIDRISTMNEIKQSLSEDIKRIDNMNRKFAG